MKLNTSRPARRVLLFAIFLLLLLGNFLTPKIVDDWAYGFSFASGEPISSLREIPASMRVHSQVINGRLFAHFLVQIFEYLPKPVFNILNTGAFLAILYLLYGFCRREEDSNLLLGCIFGAVWVFTPAFGQVFLWLDGSCNYSWGSLLVLWWLVPFVRRYLRPEEKWPGWKWGVWCLVGFFAGGYLENISAAGVFLAVVLLLLTRLYKKKETGPMPWICTAAAVAGFLFMITRPAEMQKGIGEEALTLSAFAARFVVSLKAYASLRILIFFFAAAFVLCSLKRTDRDRRILALVFLAGSVFSSALMSFAAYYPERCLIFPALLLIAGCAILFEDLFAGGYREAALCCASILLVSLLYFGCYGMADITHTFMGVRANESIIVHAREQGERNVQVPMLNVYTRYSPLYTLKYLDDEDAFSWPNTQMAKAFGVDSILGYWEVE